MKKYIFTEAQIKTIIDGLINEQTDKMVNNTGDSGFKSSINYTNDSGFKSTYQNPLVSEQMKTIKPEKYGKYCFSNEKLIELNKSRDYKLYKVNIGDTIDEIVKKLGANSISNILYFNDLLKNNPKNLKAGDVIVYSVRPTGV